MKPYSEGEHLLRSIDGPLFREQRQLLDSLITEANGNVLYGLVGLLDEIADYIHDVHGIDCLLAED